AGRTWADNTGVDRCVMTNEELNRAGRPRSMNGTLPLLGSIRRDSPEMFTAIATVLSPKDYVLKFLGGPEVTDATSAAYTLLLDVAKREWAFSTMEAHKLRSSMFPEIVESSQVIGAVSR